MPHAAGLSHRQRLAHAGPYRAAVVPSIAGATVTLPSATVALATDAEAALARVDASLAHSGIVPLPAVLLRTESASSSQIERLTASARSLAEAEIGERTGDNARLVVANVRAMERALAHEGPLTLDAILAVHSVLIEPDARHRPGLRDEQVWIGGSDAGPHRADFVPPHHEHVPEAMSDLLAFIHRIDVPTLTHVALAHAQFETIHPFTDGNGRTGRALIHMMLRGAELTRAATVPISAGLLHRTSDYFAALTAYREGDPVPIVERIAEASLLAGELTNRLVARLTALREAWGDRVSARRGAAAWRLLDALPGMPVVSYRSVMNALGVTSPTAFAAIEALETAGVVVRRSAGRRNRVWDAPEILTALDDFAEAARRR